MLPVGLAPGSFPSITRWTPANMSTYGRWKVGQLTTFDSGKTHVNTLGDLSGNGRTLTSGNGAVLPYNASDPILGGQPSLSVDGGAAYSLGFNSVNTTMFANGSDVVCIFIGYKSTDGTIFGKASVRV